MLIGEDGTTFGMLSGGCLEADLVRKARRFRALSVAEMGDAITANETCVFAQCVHYDSNDEDGFLHELGLGCGGVVDILLQAVESKNDYLQLRQVRKLLGSGVAVSYEQQIRSFDKAGIEQTFSFPTAAKLRSLNTAVPAGEVNNVSNRREIRADGVHALRSQALLSDTGAAKTLTTLIPRRVRLGVFGLGEDAKPVVEMAVAVGWEITVFDSRPGNSAKGYIASLQQGSLVAANVTPLDQMSGPELHLDAAVVMHHSLNYDTAALRLLKDASLGYCALLGPSHRKDAVLAKLRSNVDQLPWPFYGPAGFDIGAELPETIALSIIAQCHDILFKKSQ